MAYTDGFPERIVQLAQVLHQTRSAWAGGAVKPDFFEERPDRQLAWLRVACIVADDESLEVANNLPNLHACAHNVVVNHGSERLWKKLHRLREEVNRSRGAFERALDYLHGKEHIPCAAECEVRDGGLFHADDCPRSRTRLDRTGSPPRNPRLGPAPPTVVCMSCGEDRNKPAPIRCRHEANHQP